MPKPRKSVGFRLPVYEAPRNAWRQKIHKAAVEAIAKQGVQYRSEDRLKVRLRLYLDTDAALVHDVDNRLKDVLDALQGRAGGSKQVQKLKAIIPNDSQVWRVVVEKAEAPWQSHGMGHVLIQKLKI
jgi:hypothetical protein